MLTTPWSRLTRSGVAERRKSAENDHQILLRQAGSTLTKLTRLLAEIGAVRTDLTAEEQDEFDELIHDSQQALETTHEAAPDIPEPVAEVSGAPAQIEAAASKPLLPSPSAVSNPPLPSPLVGEGSGVRGRAAGVAPSRRGFLATVGSVVGALCLGCYPVAANAAPKDVNAGAAPGPANARKSRAPAPNVTIYEYDPNRKLMSVARFPEPAERSG